MYLFYVPGRGFNSPHLQNAFCNFNKTGIEPREASAEQGEEEAARMPLEASGDGLKEHTGCMRLKAVQFPPSPKRILY